MITITDLFCGAGGSTTGAVAAGASASLALNHWSRAIETHNTNYPDADHDCADVSQVNPRRYRTTDILLASPECTNHSLAKGARRRKPQASSLWDDGPAGDDEQDRSRATMWDVVRFAEAHRYRAIVVENVVDAFNWGPDDDGSLFRAWLSALTALGYEHETVMLNSMFAGPVPQSRDRMYVVFWQRGMRRPDLDVAPLSWCPSCADVVRGRQSFKPGSFARRGRWGRYGAQYVYGCPACHSVVHPGAVPAAAAIDFTLPIERIGDRKRPLAESTRTRIRNGLERLAREPFALRLLQGGAPRPLTLPLVTLTTRHDMGMCVPVAGNTYETTPGNRARDVRHRPADTVHATLDRALVVPPNTNGTARDAFTTPGTTQVTETRAALVLNSSHGGGVVDPTTQAMQTLTTCEDRSFVLASGSNGQPRAIDDEPVGALTTAGGAQLVMANRAHGVPRPADLDPAQTATTSHGGGLGIVELRNNMGVRDGDAAPAHTVCASGGHHGVLIEHYTPGRAKDPAVSPAGPITPRDHHSLVVPYRQGSARDADTDAMHTLSTVESAALVKGTKARSVTDDDIDDCYFRMFEIPEIARTMSLATHADGTPYVVLGNKREQMRQYGNAVTPPAMELLVGRIMDAMDAEAGAA